MRICMTALGMLGGSSVIANELAGAISRKKNIVHLVQLVGNMDVNIRNMDVNRDLENLERDLEKRHSKNLKLYYIKDFMFFPLYPLPLPTVSLICLLLKIIKEHNIEILHIHYAIPHIFCGYLIKKIYPQIKIILTLHGSDVLLINDEYLITLIRYLLKDIDGVTAVSYYLGEKAKEVYEKEDIKVIHNFVDTQKFAPIKDLDKKYLIKKNYTQNDEYLIINVSNFRVVKRLPEVIAVFCRIKEKLPAKLALIGQGPEFENIKKIINNLKEEKNILLLGKLGMDRLVELLQVGDLLISVSSFESFGLSVLEGMSCGLPIVAAKEGGITEVVKDGECGYLVEVGDIDGFVVSALKILENRSLKESFSQKARSIACQHFSKELITKHYLHYYEYILSLEK